MGDGPLDISQALRQHQAKFLPVTVDKEDDLTYDLGNIFAIDSHPIDLERLKTEGEEFLQSEARDNVQLLFSKIFVLPTERNLEGVFATLPAPTTKIPREKPIPKPKPETKWERFARLKGIKKTTTKRDKMVWDPESRMWKPRWGYNRANDDQHDWLIEHRPSETEDGKYEDPFLKRKADKRERIASQQKKERQNLGRAAKTGSSQYEKFLSGEIPAGAKKRQEDKELLKTELAKTRTSTASLGKFDSKLKGDDKIKRTKQKKQPVSVPGGVRAEKEKNLTLVDRMLTQDFQVSNKAVKRTRVTEEDVFPNPNKKAKRSKK